jgi:hypothetical protein
MRSIAVLAKCKVHSTIIIIIILSSSSKNSSGSSSSSVTIAECIVVPKQFCHLTGSLMHGGRSLNGACLMNNLGILQGSKMRYHISQIKLFTAAER